MICILVACALVSGHATRCDLKQPAVAEYLQVQNWTECRDLFRGVQPILQGTGWRVFRFETEPKPTTAEVLASK